MKGLHFIKNLLIDFFLSWIFLLVSGTCIFFLIYLALSNSDHSSFFLVLIFPALITSGFIANLLLYCIRTGNVPRAPNRKIKQAMLSTLIAILTSLVWTNPIVFYMLLVYGPMIINTAKGLFTIFALMSVTPLTMALMKQYHRTLDQRMLSASRLLKVEPADETGKEGTDPAS